MIVFLIVSQANLPLLQQELIQCSQIAKQSPHQYLNQHEPILHDRERLHLDPDEFVAERVGDKRKMELERLVSFGTDC